MKALFMSETSRLLIATLSQHVKIVRLLFFESIIYVRDLTFIDFNIVTACLNFKIVLFFESIVYVIDLTFIDCNIATAC